MKDNKILVLVGEIGSGKTTIAKYLEEKYQATSRRFSDPFREILGQLFLEINRENLQKLSTTLRQHFGDDLLSRVIAARVEKESNSLIVVDGARRPSDLKYLKSLPGLVLIYVVSDPRTRYERIIKRDDNSDDQHKTWEEFQVEAEQEAELAIRELQAEADFIIKNDGDFEDLYKQVDEIV